MFLNKLAIWRPPDMFNSPRPFDRYAMFIMYMTNRLRQARSITGFKLALNWLWVTELNSDLWVKTCLQCGRINLHKQSCSPTCEVLCWTSQCRGVGSHTLTCLLRQPAVSCYRTLTEPAKVCCGSFSICYFLLFKVSVIFAFSKNFRMNTHIYKN